MPTLPIIKPAGTGQETKGRQLHLSLPRLRVPFQPALFLRGAIPGHHGEFRPRWKSVAPRPERPALALPPPPAPAPPVAFARNVLGVDLWSKQVEVLTALTEGRRVAVKAGNGLGKGFCAAVAVLWFMHSHPDEAITLSTAPTFRQVRHILWRQLRRLYRPAAETLGGTMLDTRWELSDQRYAMGLSADSADQFQGFHSPNMFIVVDEAEGVKEEIYEAIEAVMTSADPLLLLIGNPTSMDGAFRRAFFEEREIYRNITISALDSPNVKAGRIVVPGLTTSAWVEERKKIWKEDSNLYQARILGQFPNQGDDTLINLVDIEAAIARFHSGPLPERERTPDPLIPEREAWFGGEIPDPSAPQLTVDRSEEVVIAVDVARYGSDRTVILRRRGDRVEDIQALVKMDTMQVVGRVAADVREHNPTCVHIDEIGVGSGVVDRLRELGCPVYGVNVARKARNDRKFINLRAEGYWRLHDLFESGHIAIPDDSQLVAELSSLRYFYVSGDRLKIERKEDIRKRHLPSPDKADALMLAFLPPPNRFGFWT